MPEEGWAMVRRRRFTGTSVCNIPNATVAFFPFMASTLPTVPWPSRRTLSSTRTGSLSAACRVFPLSFRRLGAFLAMHSLCRRCGAVLLFPHGVGVVLRVWILSRPGRALSRGWCVRWLRYYRRVSFGLLPWLRPEFRDVSRAVVRRLPHIVRGGFLFFLFLANGHSLVFPVALVAGDVE